MLYALGELILLLCGKFVCPLPITVRRVMTIDTHRHTHRHDKTCRARTNDRWTNLALSLYYYIVPFWPIVCDDTPCPWHRQTANWQKPRSPGATKPDACEWDAYLHLHVRVFASQFLYYLYLYCKQKIKWTPTDEHNLVAFNAEISRDCASGEKNFRTANFFVVVISFSSLRLLYSGLLWLRWDFDVVCICEAKRVQCIYVLWGVDVALADCRIRHFIAICIARSMHQFIPTNSISPWWQSKHPTRHKNKKKTKTAQYWAIWLNREIQMIPSHMNEKI